MVVEEMLFGILMYIKESSKQHKHAKGFSAIFRLALAYKKDRKLFMIQLVVSTDANNIVYIINIC